jgi:hypothetical protein
MTPPRRPVRPGAAGARRRAAAQPPQEPLLDENGEPIEEVAPPPKPILPVTTIITLVAVLAAAILILVVTLSRRGFMVEVENSSEEPIHQVRVRINGEQYELGDFRSNEIKSKECKRMPGDDVEVEYIMPSRGKMVRKLPKKDKDGKSFDVDFGAFKGRMRIILVPKDGIEEVDYWN